jgi:hypothetical protein
LQTTAALGHSSGRGATLPALPWPDRDPRPAVELRRSLAASREDGLRFSDAWDRAMADLRPDTHWQQAFQATRLVWAGAYWQVPSGCELRVADLIPDHEERPPELGRHRVVA